MKTGTCQVLGQMSGENPDVKNNANACLKEKSAGAGGLTVPVALSPQSNMGSPNSANGLSPSDGCDPQSPHQNPCRSNQKRNHQRKNSADGTPALVQIIRHQEGPTKVTPNDDTSKHSHRRVKDASATPHLRARHNSALSISLSNAASPAFHPYIPAAGQDYKPYYYPSMPKGYDSPSTLPSLLPIRQLECPPPSRSLSEQKADVVGGAIEGKLCRGITLTRVEIRNSYLVNCTLINCISKGCYFTSTRLFASDIVNAPCVISCSLEDSFISLSILSNCKMLQGAVKESRIMDSDIEAAGVFYCRLTRSIFYQCEYKEIEQVDCDLRECDGNGDVDAFFPIVPPPPPKSSQGKGQRSANPQTQISDSQKALQHPNRDRDREQNPQIANALANADEPNERARTQDKISACKQAPSQATDACSSGLVTEIKQSNEQHPLKTVAGGLEQQTHDSPPQNVAASEAQQSTQTAHAAQQSPAHVGEKGEKDDEHRDSCEFNQYFRNQNENEAAVPIHASGAPYPHPYEAKVGTRGRRGNMFCCQ